VCVESAGAAVSSLRRSPRSNASLAARKSASDCARASDPAKAKTVLASVAGDLKSKAADSNDPHLAAVADKFSQASQTGDLSVLQPPQGAQGSHHHGGHHHHHASSGNAQQSYDQSAASPVSDVESALESALGDAGA